MVRAKYSKNSSSAPALYISSQFANYSNVDADMKQIDKYLQAGDYGSNGKKVDVLTNQGLVYINSSLSNNAANWISQYNSTADILAGIYTGKLGGPGGASDFISLDNRHISSVSMQPISAKLKSGTTEISDATKAIWNHIKNNRQPVVVIVNSNKISGYSIQESWDIPRLHYIVIRGVYEEDRSGGIRRFMVYDPASYLRNLSYTEADLRKLMALPDNTPEWVYKYGNQKTGENPAYILMVQGD
jgi:hypothetical protein